MSETKRPITSPITGAAMAHPGAVGLVGDVAWSYAAMSRQIKRYIEFFQGLNFATGDRIMVIASPSGKFCIALWALFHNSSMVCPVNPAFPKRVLEDLVDRLRPACILYDRSKEEQALGIAARRIAMSDLPGLADGSANTKPLPLLDSMAHATAICTSGSSGTPKIAVHTLDNHLYAAGRANANLPLVPGDVWLLSLPLYHVSGMSLVFRCAQAGATLALPEPGAALEEELARLGATHVSLVPTQLSRLLASDRGVEVLRDMKGVLLGGASAEDTLIQRAWEAQIPLVRSYGMTETSAQLCATKPGAPLADLYSSGRPFDPDSLRIAEDGVIEVRGSTIFAGYYQTGGGVIRPETGDGWFRTGDRGCFDEEGRLHVQGRTDTMFVSGGENVYPEEIERVLKGMPGVEEAVVVAVPDPEYGSLPAAFIRWVGSVPLEEAALRARLLSELPRYKMPRAFIPWPENAPNGIKPDRAYLGALAAKQAATDA